VPTAAKKNCWGGRVTYISGNTDVGSNFRTRSNMKYLLMLFFISIFLKSYSQQDLIGSWRRINPNDKQKVIQDNDPQTGDLSIFKDSTFIIQGDSANLKSNKIDGWVSLNEYHGTWKQPDDKHLTLEGHSKQSNLSLPFSIIKLTKDKLVLRPVWLKRKTKFSDWIYHRI
jgi:hypothetical protein